MTPSQRKVISLLSSFQSLPINSRLQYLDVILSAWGNWSLFQELLVVLRAIGDRHEGVSISNVAIRWVLDQDVVGAVLIGMCPRVPVSPFYLASFSSQSHVAHTCSGTRLGVSEHLEDNHRVFSFKLTDQDKEEIDKVLEKSNGAKLIETLGDCGAEYRQR